jgi:hypothetical protein
MTVQSTFRKAGPFLGNDSTTSFPFTFKVFAEEDLKVILTNAAGVDTELTLDNDYSVTLNGDQEAAPGGSVTCPISGTPIATGQKLTIVSAQETEQGTELTNGGGFFPKTIEDRLDASVISIQQLEELLERALIVSASDDSPALDLGTAEQRAGKAIVFDNDGNPTLVDSPIPTTVNNVDVTQVNRPNVAQIGIIFDDGYEGVYTQAFPLFQKYGFTGTVAMEFEKINAGRYAGTSDYDIHPVLSIEQIREMIDAGWEFANHPLLDAGALADEDELVSDVQAQNELFVELLTGETVITHSDPPNPSAVYSPGTIVRPDLADYKVTSAVFRGGLQDNDPIRRQGFGYAFERFRTINGAASGVGDARFMGSFFDPDELMHSAQVVDTSSVNIQRVLDLVQGVRSAGGWLLLYAHEVHASDIGSVVPWLLTSELEQILELCARTGVQVGPYRTTVTGQVYNNHRFDVAEGAFTTNSGDTAEFSATDTLHGADRCVVLTTVADRSNHNTNFTTRQFAVQPFSRYKVRVRYKIDVELTGAGNATDGLIVSMRTFAADTEATITCQHQSSIENTYLEVDAPYQVTSGYAETEAVLVTGHGSRANIRLSLFGATGTVRVGEVSVEKQESIIQAPFVRSLTFNTSSFRNVDLPDPVETGLRGWGWEVSVHHTAVQEPVEAVDYAYEDSEDVPTPEAGDTVYVLGHGLNAFATWGGRVATFDDPSWSVSDPISNNSMFTVTLAEGIAGRRFIHKSRTITSGSRAIEVYNAVVGAQPIVRKVVDTLFRVYEASGYRTDAFIAVARPVLLV